MAKINAKYINEVLWSQFNEHLYVDNVLKEQANDSNFRILKIVDYNHVNEKELFELRNYYLKKVIVASSNLFFLIIETADKDFDKTILKHVIHDILKDSGKYLLIEMCYGSNDIVRYIFNGSTVEELFNEQLNDFVEEVDDSLLLCCLHSSTFEHLKNVSANVQPSVSPLVSIAIRLIKTFDIVCTEDIEKSILENLVCNSNVNAFRAYLDLPVVDDGKSIKHTTFTAKAVDYKFDNNETLLFFAANADFNMLELLLRLGADVHAQNYYLETVSEHVMENYKNLKLLLEYDAKFPRDFHQIYYSQSFGCDEIQEEIRKICVERQNLHDAIADKSEEDYKIIELFEEKFPLLKFAYNFIDEAPYSQAATTTALKEVMQSERDDFGLYLFLIDKGFCVNECELYFMTMADKNKVSAMILNNIKTTQPSHITFLRGKTFIYGIDIAEQGLYKEKIKKIYYELNDISELASILKIVEHSKSLSVSVDFRSRSVVNLDITASNDMDGLTYHNIGRIYLSVSNKSDNEIAGIVIHELTHFALHIVFNNNGNPYFKFDGTGKDKFNKIVEKLKNLPDNHDVVKKVYTSYKKISRPKELIARVPQLIALGLSEDDREKYAELIKFYHDHVLPYMQRATSDPEYFFITREVQQLNEFLRHTAQIEKWNVVLNRTSLSEAIYDGQNVKKVVCDIPRLFLADFYNEVVKKNFICTPGAVDIQQQCEKYFIFASIEDFESSSTSTYIERIWSLTSNITLILDVDKFAIMNSAFRTKLFNNTVPSNNVIVFGQDPGTLECIFKKQNNYFMLEYDWKQLSENCRKNFLKTTINFQTSPIPLNKLIDDEFSNIPMKKLINQEEICIAASDDINDYDEETFVERSLKHCDQEYNNLDDVLSLSMNQITSVLISAFPGSGQSTLIARIAITLKDDNRSPNFWLAKINIDQLSLACKDTSTDNHLDIVWKYFVHTKSTSDPEFELSLFKKLYDKSEVIFLFDSIVDLSEEYTDQVLPLINKLSEKNRLWITTHNDSRLKNKLEKKLSNKIVLELLPFSFSEHVESAIKIWQKELELFDSANESKLNSCATKILQLYSQFIGLPKLTSIIANKYLKHVKKYMESSDESCEPFIPGNIYTNTDIYDLCKELYSEIIQKRYNRRDGLNAANESTEAIILNMNMFSAFEQYADYMLENSEKDKLRQKPLLMYAIGLDDLLRYGIISYKFELTSTIGSHYFLSNYIVKSMESSYKLYGHLCQIIINKERNLIKFIDERMKDSSLFHDIDFSKLSFTQKYNQKHSKLAFDDIMYLLNENAILLLSFILQSLEKSKAEKKKECFNECAIFWKASEKCLRCIIEILWNISSELFIEYLGRPDAAGFNPFQYAFMNFPQNDLDVVRDTTTIYHFSNSLREQEAFKDVLRKPAQEKHQNSTLGFYVEKILDKFTDDKRNGFIYQYSEPQAVFEYNICSDHFDETIERKWTAMTQINFPTNDWVKLTTETMFRYVVHIIFNKFNNHIVLKFYKWANSKTKNDDEFNSFVAKTFANYFWNCTSENHGKEIIDFVRNKINIEEVLQQQGIEVINKMFQILQSHPQRNSVRNNFIENMSLCHKLLTEKELEILMFHKTENQNENLISKVCESSDDETIKQIFGIVPLKKIMENAEINESLLYALMSHMVGNLDEIRDEMVIKSIIVFIGNQNRQLVTNALCTLTIEVSFFHLALVGRNMFMAQLVWKMAKLYLNEEQFREQLLDRYNYYPDL